MKNLKSHFQYSKKERNGIFSLLILIIVLQCFYFFIESNYSNKKLQKELSLSTKELALFEAEIETLRKINTETAYSKKHYFNPNFITDYKGYNLGMTNEEIDRLLDFRKLNKWVNSAKEFQQVTKVSDSMLAVLSANFKFPKWTTNKRKSKKPNGVLVPLKNKIDLNKATALQLEEVKGVGAKLSQRIIKYRATQKGFVNIIELLEIYGLSHEVIVEIEKHFSVKTPRFISLLSLNKATRDELVKIKYIDYDIAHNILEERALREGYKSVEDLKKVKNFPLNKFEIIKLYLQLD